MKIEAMTDVKSELRKRCVQYLGERPGIDFMVERLHSAGMAGYFAGVKSEMEVIAYEQIAKAKTSKKESEKEDEDVQTK